MHAQSSKSENVLNKAKYSNSYAAPVEPNLCGDQQPVKARLVTTPFSETIPAEMNRRSSEMRTQYGILSSAIGSAARNGETVSRRRFQKGSVYKNKSGTIWLGMYSEYVLDSSGIEKRSRKQVVLGPVRKADGIEMRKREAQRMLQPYVDRVNSSLAAPIRERKSATFEAFAEIWERDYLSLSKPSTQSSVRGQLRMLKQAFGKKDMRQIDAGDMQRIIAAMDADNFDPKTIRNLWATVRLMWDAALAQKYVDQVLPKPKLPRLVKKTPRFFRHDEIARIIASSEAELRVFYWLAAESGLRQGELVGLTVTDIESDKLKVNQSVWGGKVQTPKTTNAIRTIALSPQLVDLVWEQIVRQRAKGHEFLFSTRTGRPWDPNLLRQRRLHPLLKKLKIQQAGFHAFRHFNASMLDSLRVPLKVIQERLGHALTGSFTLDVYGHSLDWKYNAEAAIKAGAVIAEAVKKFENSVSLTAVNGNGLQSPKLEAVVR